MSYYANTAPTDASPFGIASLFALWTLPFTLTQTWMTAWTRQSDDTIDPLDDADRLTDSAEGGQIPVPGVIQDSKDSAIYA